MSNDTKIRGWLILLGLQIVTILLIAITTAKTYIDSIRFSWTSITEVEGALFRKVFIIYNTLFYLLMTFGGIFILVIFLSKKQRFRDYYSIYMVFIIIGYIGEYLIVSKMDSSFIKYLSEIEATIFVNIIWSAIWISYLFKAKRPQYTFIN
jgi:hypothetical protein